MSWHILTPPTHVDPRGALTAIDEHEFPFVPKRVYWIHDVPAGTIRGAHAHREQHQILVCLSGRLSVPLDNGHGRTETVILDDPRFALHIEPMVWSHQQALDAGTRWVFIASGRLDPAEYVRTPDDFRALFA